MGHDITIRVYYEDTDLAGIVYYANYLKFIERGRTEWLRARGVEQGAMLAETGAVFAVTRLSAEYRSPARYDDLLTVTTEAVEIGGARVVMDQVVRRDGAVLFTARVTIACVDQASGRARRLPPAVREALA